MGNCFFYYGEPNQITVFKNSTPRISKLTLVYSQSSYRMGFDADEIGKSALKSIVHSSVYFERNTGLLNEYPTNPEILVQTIRRDCTLALVSSEQHLLQYLKVSRDFESKRRGAELKRRYRKMSAVLESKKPDILRVYDTEHDVIDIDDEQFKELQIEIAIKWKISDFGLHCYLCGLSEGVLFDKIESIGRIEGLNIVECKLESELPVT